MNSNPCTASALWLSSPTRFVTCCCCCCCCCRFCHCQCRQLLLTHSRYTSRFETLQAEQVRLQQHSCVHFTPFYFITLSSDAATTIVIAATATIATADSITAVAAASPTYLLSRRVPHFELLRAEWVRLLRSPRLHSNP